jgi:spore maturation protein CgeB
MGIEQFFTPGEEILLAGSAEEATAALDLPAADLARIGRAARERALDEHTSDCRAARMLSLLEDTASRGS